MIHSLRIVIRGAGDLASGVALRLWRSGFRRMVLLECRAPLAVRRLVSFSEAVRQGAWSVEGVTAELAADLPGVDAALARGRLPIIMDPMAEFARLVRPDVLVDAIMAKRNLGTSLDMAELVVAIGPGFTAGIDCHRVVETHRGHGLGRVIASGGAMADTGVPGEVMGYTTQRVLRAPCAGTFQTDMAIGQSVVAGHAVGRVNGEPVTSSISGVLRGLLPPGTPVGEGLKLGDVDPRGDASRCAVVSDKALAVGGGVLEAILQRFNTGPGQAAWSLDGQA